jgi:integrase
VSPSTRNRQVYAPVSAVLKSAGSALRLRRPKPPPGVTRWLTHDEAARLLAACSPHLRPLVRFLLFTGARAAEALWLDWRCVDLARAHVSFSKTKNGTARGMPLHRDLVAELANLPHRDGCVFRRPDGKPYPPRPALNASAGCVFRTAFQTAVRRAGLTNFRVHDCRHTWATWFFAAHHDLIALQTLGGWKTLSMVTRYAHSNSETYRESINALPSIREKSGNEKSREREAS